MRPEPSYGGPQSVQGIEEPKRRIPHRAPVGSDKKAAKYDGSSGERENSIGRHDNPPGARFLECISAGEDSSVSAVTAVKGASGCSRLREGVSAL